MTDNEKFIQFKRLKIPYEDYIINPVKTILSFIGIDSTIIDYKENSIYMDGYIIVDVKFTALDLNPCLLYWVQFKDCQKMNTQSENKYITQINNMNVCMTIKNTSELNQESWIPFTISQALTEGGAKMIYKYYSIIMDTPFNYASTEVFTFSRKFKDVDFDKCNINKPLKNNPLNFQMKDIIQLFHRNKEDISIQF